jgi:hypothetical protein
MKIVRVMFCSSGSFRVFKRNTTIGAHLEFLSAVNQPKTPAAATIGLKNVFSNPSQTLLSSDISSAKLFSSNSVYQEKSTLPLKLPTSRSFVEALAVEALTTATNRTVSKEERSAILSTLDTVVDDLNEIDLSRTVCR